MEQSIFDLFSVGIGPSSSHTIGPMSAAVSFCKDLEEKSLLTKISNIKAHLYGSLALTGKGHGTDKAIILGLSGYKPEVIDPKDVDGILTNLENTGKLSILNKHPVTFLAAEHIIFNYVDLLPLHPNGMHFYAYDKNDNILFDDIYYSIGGGFIIQKEEDNSPTSKNKLPFPFRTGDQLIDMCNSENKTIAEIMYANEKEKLSLKEINANLDKLWQIMHNSIELGCQTEGILPGGLNVRRRAPGLFKNMQDKDKADTGWLSVYAIAVNEENAAGGRIVTAPTNGAAGVIPAILKYYQERYNDHSKESVYNFLLTAGAIGFLFKLGASISAAEMGCQGEIGVASSMAAGALTAVLGGTPDQVEKAAEIGIEHHLGLTCDPIAGLVQIPCIERNSMGAIKALNASQIALMEDDKHFVTLDNAIATMKETGHAMCSKYKETSQGGLAKNVPEC